MSISAMKEALEALENTYAYLPRRWGGEREADQAISALRQAIAEAEQPDLARVGEVGVWGDKREWVGLTNEEIVGFIAFDGASLADFIRYIEAKLKEKNS
jgi:protein tyrosine phosphatase (PTP) superfamily phosphohydrolase (DUF442 family)